MTDPAPVFHHLEAGMNVLWRPARSLRCVVRVLQPGPRETLVAHGDAEAIVSTTLLSLIPHSPYCGRCGEHIVAETILFCDACKTSRLAEAHAAKLARESACPDREAALG